MLPLVALVLLVLLGLFLGQAGATVLPEGRWYGLGAALAIGMAVIVLVIRISRRR
jgi:hypothetical protein